MSIHVTVYGSVKKCSLCNDLIEKENKAMLQCAHVLHQSCVNEDGGKKRCPICAKKIESSEYSSVQAVILIAFFVFTYSLFPSPLQ